MHSFHAPKYTTQIKIHIIPINLTISVRKDQPRDMTVLVLAVNIKSVTIAGSSFFIKLSN